MTRLILLHTCESEGTARANADYLTRIGAEPHWVFDPRFPLDEAIQMLPHTAIGKALRNLPGGVETNRLDVDRDGVPDVIQVELVGYAAHVAGYDDAWYRRLREFLTWLCAATGVPYRFPLRFAESYADAANVRGTFAAWVDPGLTGVIGHCHAPENDHWDPGPLDLARLAPEALWPASAPSAPSVPPSEEDDMSLTIHRPHLRPGTTDVVDFPWLPEEGRLWGVRRCSSTLVVAMATEAGNSMVTLNFDAGSPVSHQLAWGKPLVIGVPVAGMVSVSGENLVAHAREAWA